MVLVRLLISTARLVVEAGSALLMTAAVYLLPILLWLIAPTVPISELDSDEATERVAFLITEGALSSLVSAGSDEAEDNADAEGDEAAETDGRDERERSGEEVGSGDAAEGAQSAGDVGDEADGGEARVVRRDPMARNNGLRAKSLIDHRADKARKEARRAEARRRAQERKAKSRVCEHSSDRIEDLGNNTFRMERGLVDFYATHLEAFDDLGWSRPYKPEGVEQSEGIEVGGIRCGSDLRLLGVKNRDVVRTVNGKPVRTMLKAATLYLSQRGRDTVTVVVDRKGEEVELTYHLY